MEAIKDLFAKGWNGEIDDKKFSTPEEVYEYLFTPPAGWTFFGAHLNHPGTLHYLETGSDGLPRWESCATGCDLEQK